MLDAILKSIKANRPDFATIIKFLNEIISVLPENARNEQRAQIENTLHEQEVSDETVWIMAVFQFDSLLEKTFSKLQKIININFSPPIEGLSSTLWLLTKHNKHDLLEKALSHSNSFSPFDWNAMPTGGPDKNQSILLLLAIQKQWNILKKILLNPTLIFQPNLNTVPTEGLHKDQSLLWTLVFHRQWNLAENILIQRNKSCDSPIMISAPAMSRELSFLWLITINDQDNLLKIIAAMPELFAHLNWNTSSPYKKQQAPSALWILAAKKKWTLLKLLLINLRQFPQLNWNAAPSEGEHKDISVLWLLVANQQWDLLKLLLADLSQFPQLNWSAAPTEGKHKDLSSIWVLINRKQWNTLKLIFSNPGKFLIFDTAKPIKNSSSALSILKRLIDCNAWELIKIIFEQPGLLLQIDLNENISFGFDLEQSKTIVKNMWQVLLGYKQWQCIELILQRLNKISNVNFINEVDIFSQLWGCPDKTQRSLLIKLYLLSGRSFENIPPDCQEKLAQYQNELNTIDGIAISVLNYWDNNETFKKIPPEIRLEIAVAGLFVCNPEFAKNVVLGDLLRERLNVSVRKHHEALKEHSYKITAQLGLKFFNQLHTSNTSKVECAQIVNWLKNANTGDYLIRQSKRSRLIKALVDQETLTMDTVKAAFEQTFKMPVKFSNPVSFFNIPADEAEQDSNEILPTFTQR